MTELSFNNDFSRLSFADLYAVWQYAFDISDSYDDCRRDDISPDETKGLSLFFLQISTQAAAEMERRMTEKFSRVVNKGFQLEHTELKRDDAHVRYTDYMESKL